MTDSADGVIVTGAGRGIGRAAAELLAARGWTVGCVDRDADVAEATAAAARAAGGTASAMPLDVTDRAAVIAGFDAFAAEYGLRALVNNAMWIAFSPVEDMREPEIDRMLAVGIKGTLWCVQAALPHLAARAAGGRDATVVNVASGAAFRGTPQFSIYAAVKGGIVALTRQNAVELGPRGIRFNAVAPGPIPTETALAATPDAEAWRLNTERRTPLRRMGTAAEVAGVIAFLCGGDSTWVNGQVIEIDGGKSASS